MKEIIEVRYLLATNKYGARVKASCMGLMITRNFNSELSLEGNYLKVAEELSVILDWQNVRLAGGYTKSGLIVFVAVNKE